MQNVRSLYSKWSVLHYPDKELCQVDSLRAEMMEALKRDGRERQRLISDLSRIDSIPSAALTTLVDLVFSLLMTSVQLDFPYEIQRISVNYEEDLNALKIISRGLVTLFDKSKSDFLFSTSTHFKLILDCKQT